MNLNDLDPGTLDELTVVIEIPKGSKLKYEYSKEGYLFLDRIIHSPMVYIFDYGFVPSTLSEDGDPLDVMVLMERPTFPGCVMKVRPVGVLMAEDEKGMDYKLITVPIEKIDPTQKHIKDITDVPEHIRLELEAFIKHYKELEHDKWAKSYGFKGVETAKEIITKSIEKYKGVK